MPRWPLLVLVVVVVAGAAIAVQAVRPGPAPGRIEEGEPAARGAKVLRYRIASRFVDRRLRQVGIVPAGGAAQPRPLLVFLHGRGRRGEEASADKAFFGALAALGDRAPAVVFPNGGEASYFHRRKSGDWGRYVLDEVIPRAIRRLGADPERVAIGGISMGGFGAYSIARLRPGRFCAVGGHSAALWLRAGDTAPGAFDDAADFARNDVVRIARERGRAAWGDAALWLDAGTDDPFVPANRALAGALGVRLRAPEGGHTRAYWRASYGRYLRFYADALADCRGSERTASASRVMPSSISSGVTPE